MEQSEEKCKKEEEVLLDTEREVRERCQANASNQEDPEEIEAELKKIEEKIDAEREKLLEQVKDFQTYLEKQIAAEKNEAKQLRAEHDELKLLKQQILHSAGENEDGDEENGRARQSLNDQLLNPTLEQRSLIGSPVLTPPDPTNGQLKAELECVQLQLEADRQALEEANELLAAEETA